jgi:hypothetical protein
MSAGTGLVSHATFHSVTERNRALWREGGVNCKPERPVMPAGDEPSGQHEQIRLVLPLGVVVE